jgi:opacity protein-like surface antigen
MKKTILSFAVIFFTAFVSSAQAPQAVPATTVAPENPNAPDAVYEKEVLDYGTIEYDSDGSREFKFKNTGKEPLIIYSATGSCGCTVPTAPKEPIKPGETASIKVHYDTKRVGSFEKTVTVASNGKTASKTLKIKGTVKAAATPAATSTVTPGH